MTIDCKFAFEIRYTGYEKLFIISLTLDACCPTDDTKIRKCYTTETDQYHIFYDSESLSVINRLMQSCVFQKLQTKA